MAVLVIIGLVLGGIVLYLNLTYTKANENLSSGNYDEAKVTFEKLSNYKDSLILTFECDYRKAGALLEGKSFDEAKALYGTITGYKDSKNQMTECDYQKAVEVFSEKKYDEAKPLFEALKPYGDSESMIIECDYRKTYELLDDVYLNDYVEVIKVVPGYLKSPNLWNFATVEIDEERENSILAEGILDFQREKELRELFLEYDGYSDSGEVVKKLTCEIASKMFINKDFEAAQAEFLKFPEDELMTFYAQTCEMEMIKEMCSNKERYTEEIGKRLVPVINDSSFLDFYFGRGSKFGTSNSFKGSKNEVTFQADAYTYDEEDMEIRYLYFDSDDEYDAFSFTYLFGDPEKQFTNYSKAVFGSYYYSNGDYLSVYDIFDMVDAM